jgi:uncharacterized metal-binding protein
MRQILLDITNGYDIMLKSTSIAGVAMKVYRKLFLKENQIAIVPDRGYERNDKVQLHPYSPPFPSPPTH